MAKGEHRTLESGFCMKQTIYGHTYTVGSECVEIRHVCMHDTSLPACCITSCVDSPSSTRPLPEETIPDKVCPLWQHIIPNNAH